MTRWDPDAFNTGILDFAAGMSIDDNPYDIEVDDFKHDSWEEGWIKASNSSFCRRLNNRIGSH